MHFHVGTSGYSYKEWKGPFYPEKIKPADMLGFYAERLSSVEINNTFYRLPKRSVVESWASQVPESFRFSIKASRRITHFKRLKETDEVLGYLLETTAALGDRLGVVLFQLPPNLKCDVERLETFCKLLPDGFPAAFEFRNESWQDEAVHAVLRERNFATVVVSKEDEDRPEIIRTASWGYLRLRRPDYDGDALAEWAREIRATGWEQAFVFFKHEDEGAGPRMAADFVSAVAASETAKPRKVAARRAVSTRQAG